MDRIENAGSWLADNKMVWKRQFPVKPERLWNTIATKEGLSHWFMPTEFEIEEGRRFSFQGGWDGTVSEVSPHHHLQFDVEGDSGGFLRFEMESNDDGCLFSLIDRMGEGVDAKEIFGLDADQIHQPGGPGTHWSGVTGGYHCFVDALEGQVTGNSVASDYDEMCKLYEPVLDDYFRRGGK